MRRVRLPVLAVVAVAVAVLAATTASPVFATFPYPSGGNPYDYTRLHITNGSCADVPAGQAKPADSDLAAGFDCRDSTKLTDYAAQPGDLDYDPTVANNPQELFGVKGS